MLFNTAQGRRSTNFVFRLLISLFASRLAFVQDHAFLSFRGMLQTHAPTRPFKQEAKLEQHTDQFIISRINHATNTR
jgi:hypothetical protein